MNQMAVLPLMWLAIYECRVVDVAEDREPYVVEGRMAFRVDQFPLEEPVDRLCQGVAKAVALRVDRGDDLVVGEPLVVARAWARTTLV